MGTSLTRIEGPADGIVFRRRHQGGSQSNVQPSAKSSRETDTQRGGSRTVRRTDVGGTWGQQRREEDLQRSLTPAPRTRREAASVVWAAPSGHLSGSRLWTSGLDECIKGSDLHAQRLQCMHPSRVATRTPGAPVPSACPCPPTR